MSKMHRLVVLLCLPVSVTIVGKAEPSHAADLPVRPAPPIEATVSRRAFTVSELRGCYWQFGTLYCHRFCYTDINGIRYCRDD